MMAEMEFTGRNVKKALQEAAESLGIPAEKIEYEVLSHGSLGIFGLAGVKKARIVVKYREEKEHPREDMEPGDTTGKDADERDPESTASITTEEAIQLGEAVLQHMVDAISPEAKIAVERNDKRVRFIIEGGQSGILIGKRGQTLDAMQLLVEKAVRRLNGHGLRLQVDVEGYLAKKKAGLVQTAERVAKKVASKGSPSSIGYLNAQDRRIVHLALKNKHGVRTKSVGEGPIRKLMVYPQRNQKKKS
jgi:spoIIIJ-associated protein